MGEIRTNCSNKASIREDLLTQAVIDHMVGVLRSEDTLDTLRAEAEVLAREASHRIGAEEQRLTRALNCVEAEVERLMDAIKSNQTWTYGLAHSMIIEELDRVGKEKQLLEQQLLNLRNHSSGTRLPTSEELVQLARSMETELREDPVALRAVLHRMTWDGKIILEPQPDGSYVANSFFLPLVVPPPTPRTRKPRSKGTRASSGDTTEVVYNVGCAGAQCSLYTAISLGFERRLVA